MSFAGGKGMDFENYLEAFEDFVAMVAASTAACSKFFKFIPSFFVSIVFLAIIAMGILYRGHMLVQDRGMSLVTALERRVADTRRLHLL